MSYNRKKETLHISSLFRYIILKSMSPNIYCIWLILVLSVLSSISTKRKVLMKPTWENSTLGFIEDVC